MRTSFLKYDMLAPSQVPCRDSTVSMDDNNPASGDSINASHSISPIAAPIPTEVTTWARSKSSSVDVTELQGGIGVILRPSRRLVRLARWTSSY